MLVENEITELIDYIKAPYDGDMDYVLNKLNVIKELIKPTLLMIETNDENEPCKEAFKQNITVHTNDGDFKEDWWFVKVQFIEEIFVMFKWQKFAISMIDKQYPNQKFDTKAIFVIYFPVEDD